MSNKLKLLIIGGLIVVAVGVIGNLYFKTEKKFSREKETKTPVNQIQSRKDFNSEINNFDWMIYKNEELGFEIEYPKYAKVMSLPKLYPDGEVELFDLELPLVQKKTKLTRKDFVISIHSVTSNVCINTNRYLKNIKEVSINGIKFKKYTDRTGGTETIGYSTNYFTTRGNWCFELICHLSGCRYCPLPKPDVSKETKICDEIVSTFKFIDSSR